jgi:anti-sigma28 factor (negative regulator of flagellin synthesis)
VGSSKRKNVLFPSLEEDCSREEKVKRIKRMIQENDYITDEKLDSALAKLLDEIDQD